MLLRQELQFYMILILYYFFARGIMHSYKRSHTIQVEGQDIISISFLLDLYTGIYHSCAFNLARNLEQK